MRRLAALALILLLASCTNPIVQADVTRFNDMPVAQTHSFTIVPDAGQVASLEFQGYATQIATALTAQGWRPIPPGGTAETSVALHWGVGPPDTVSWQSPSSVYSGFGWGGGPRYYGGGLYDPFPYWESRSITYYPKWLAVQITDARSGIRKVLFEGRAVAEGTRREIAPVMPYLVQALFTGFPGANGATVRVNVPIRE
ncbi:MAG: DUF4136 domain-containing protein [Rhodospirillaceae bacterium]|nr:DUF4136 domain-containing protein [Rhodospirillales bacterium]